MIDYITVQDAAGKWGLSRRRVQVLCNLGKVQGAIRFGNAWMIPKDGEKPLDTRFKANKTLKVSESEADK